MNTNQTKQDDEIKQNDEIIKPLSVRDLMGPTDELEETSPQREWQIKKLQEKLGVSRDIAEKMVDESGGSV
jgi:hypothetical protein